MIGTYSSRCSENPKPYGITWTAWGDPPIHLLKNRLYLHPITGSVDLNSGHFMKLSTPILALDAVGLLQLKPTP